MHTLEEIVRMIDALDVWEKAKSCTWALKPSGTVFPYFCSVVHAKEPPVKARLILLEGWQTLNDYARMVHSSEGFYTCSAELPHYEAILLTDGRVEAYRYDLDFVPASLSEAQNAFVSRLLWETYGLLLRFEGDPRLFMKFADQTGVFARVEGANGQWSDQPLPLVNCPAPQEDFQIEAQTLKKVKDLPIAADLSIEADFILLPELRSCHDRPRSVYTLLVADAKTGVKLIDDRIVAGPGFGLRDIWEALPEHLLETFVKMKRVPGGIRVGSARMFRAIRTLCTDLPFKLSLHDRLEVLEKVRAELTRQIVSSAPPPPETQSAGGDALGAPPHR